MYVTVQRELPWVKGQFTFGSYIKAVRYNSFGEM